jgi:SAM-dependent methyltransferase
MKHAASFRRRPARTPPPAASELPRRLIARYAPGQTFIDVGCMWQTHGAHAFHAVARGATRVVGLDVTGPTPEFLAANAARGNPVRFVQGDVNAPTIVDEVGPADVVFCGGVLYHVPNPVLTLEQLRRLCQHTLILSSVTLPEQGVPQSAVFLPFLDPAVRARLAGVIVGPRRNGLDTAFDPLADYASWFWLLSPSGIEAMLRLVGFDLVERHVFEHDACFVCTVR